MPALRYSEDTEFNDALRARGILPALPAEPESPEPVSPLEQGPQDLVDELDSQKDIEALELDHDIPAHLVDAWKTARLAELRHAAHTTNMRASGLRPIGKEDYVREVNRASEADVDPGSNLVERGTGVVVCLWNNSSASRHLLGLLEKLSAQYPATRFLSIPGGSCIANYPDANQPTLICYRAGRCLRQYVGIGSAAASQASQPNNGRLGAGVSTTLDDLEAELLAVGALDHALKVMASAASHHADLDSGDDQNFNSKSKKNIRVTSANGSDSELDI